MKTEWKICIVSLIGTAAISSPTWLPVFGIEPEWFKWSVVLFVSATAPFLTFGIGIAAGWFAKRFQMESVSPNTGASNPLGLSKMTYDEYRKMEESDIDAFKKLCATCVAGYKRNETNPLIFSLDYNLDILGLDRTSIERIQDLKLVSIAKDADRMMEVIKGYHIAQEDIYYDREPYMISISYRFDNKTIRVNAPVVYVPNSGMFTSKAFAKEYGIVSFTTQGKELSEALGVRVSPKIEDYLKTELSRMNQDEWNKI